MSLDSPVTRRGNSVARIDYVDALRGLACLFVVIFHLLGGGNPVKTQQWLAVHHKPMLDAVVRTIFSYGASGVALFLVLSGFCLFWPVLRKFQLSEVRVDYRQFMQRRARRILPPYYVALILFFVYELLIPFSKTGEKTSGGVSLLLHLLMLHNLSPQSVSTINGSFWSLAVEWQMYLAFPLFFWLIRRGGLGLMLGTSLSVAALWHWQAATHFSSPHWLAEMLSALKNASPFDFCWYFAVGLAAAYFVADSAHPRVRVWITGIGMAAFLPAIYLALHPFPLSPVNFFWGLGFTGLVVGTSYVKPGIFQARGWLHPLTWLGTCSYSVYLVHQPIIFLMQHLVSSQKCLLLAPVLILVSGYLFHLAFERPFMSKPGRPAPQTERQAEVAAIGNPAP